MRRAVTSLGVAVLLLATAACNHTRLGSLFSRGPTEPIPKEAPTAVQLVDYLNENARRVQSLRCDNLDITAKQGLIPVGLQGRMVCQQPRNFFLRAGVGGMDELDLGSNNDEFWYWVKRGDNAQIHCSYKDLQEGRVKQMPFPFQPDWIMEALGMGNYGPAEKYQLLVEADKLKLVEKTRSPQGKAVRKVMVINRRPVQPPNPQVTDFLLLDDASGSTICSAHVTQVQMDPAKGGLYPRRLELRWPAQKVTMTLEMRTATPNVDFPPDFPAFVRRPMSGIPCYDLATGRMDSQPSSLQRAGFDRRK